MHATEQAVLKGGEAHMCACVCVPGEGAVRRGGY